MGRITLTCSRTLTWALPLALVATPVLASKEDEDYRVLDSYVAARMAEIREQDQDAVKRYLKLYTLAPHSEVLTDRLYISALRAGDMAAAVRAVRAQELQGEDSNEGPLILFADAFKRKNWSMATLAAKELEDESYFGFMAPLLRAWIDVAQRKPYTLEQADPEKQPFLVYYSGDQRVYLDIASGDVERAKLPLRGYATAKVVFANDLLIRAGPVYAAKGDGDFAAALLNSVVDRDYAVATLQTKSKDPMAIISPEEGLAALHVRIAETLLEQNSSEAALAFVRIAYWLAPNSQSAKLTLADTLASQELPAPAIMLRQSVPATSPYWPRAVGDTLRQFDKDNQPEAALEVAQAARKARPQSANMALLLAQAYENTGNLAEATKVYRQIIDDADYARAAPQLRATYRLLLATALDSEGDWAGAKVRLQEAQELDPNNSAILNYLGYSLLDRKEDTTRALELIEKAHALAPQSVAITDSLGWAKYHQSDYVEAVALLEKAAKSSGADATINEHLGDAYWKSGRRVEARYAWRVAANGAEGDVAQRLATKLDIGIPEVPQKP